MYNWPTDRVDRELLTGEKRGWVVLFARFQNNIFDLSYWLRSWSQLVHNCPVPLNSEPLTGEKGEWVVLLARFQKNWQHLPHLSPPPPPPLGFAHRSLTPIWYLPSHIVMQRYFTGQRKHKKYTDRWQLKTHGWKVMVILVWIRNYNSNGCFLPCNTN